MPTLEKIGNLQGFTGIKKLLYRLVGVKEVSENVSDKITLGNFNKNTTKSKIP